VDIFPLLNIAIAKRASDVHLVADRPPLLRIDGSLDPLPDAPPLAAEEVDECFSQLVTDREKQEFERRLELDFGYSLPYARIRCNVSKQRGTTCLSIRLLPLTIPTIDELELPQVCKELVLRPRGLIIVSGPTGSGKSTTLAAMINYLNGIRSRRVVTIEDPIEYVYTNNKCTVTQRELGVDTHSFVEALRHILRQDPDVILVGEMRDLETAAAVLTVAETGHLVLTTGHAPSASQAVERVIDLFPPHERYLAQSRLASLLLGILCQCLIPRAYNTGRVAAVEIMLANAAVKNLIREGKIYQLPNTIRMNNQAGMQLLDQALVDLYHKRIISTENLLAFCNDRDEVAQLSSEVEAR